MTAPHIAAFTPRRVAEADALGSVAARWLSHLAERGRAANTLAAYRRDLEQLAGFLQGRGVESVRDITAHLLEAFLSALLGGEGNAPRTVARKMQSVEGFIKFAVARGLIPVQASPLLGADLTISFQSAPPNPPATDALLRLINGIPADSPQGKRDRALFRLMFDTALRVSGLLSLDVFDADAPPRCTVWPNGVVHYAAKGGAIKTAWCDTRTLAALQDWLAVRHALAKRDTGPALFLSNRGRRMTRGNMHHLIKQYGRAAGLPDVHCHLLRHRRIRDVLDATDDIRLAQDLAGHGSIRTTLDIYGSRSAAATRRKLAAVPLEPGEVA